MDAKQICLLWFRSALTSPSTVLDAGMHLFKIQFRFNLSTDSQLLTFNQSSTELAPSFFAACSPKQSRSVALTFPTKSACTTKLGYMGIHMKTMKKCGAILMFPSLTERYQETPIFPISHKISRF